MKLEIVSRPDWAKIAKNVRFGVAVGLTKTAKAAQTEVISEIEKQFTVRGSWHKPSSRFGVRITPAKRDNPEASVHTAADWLVIHETGGTKSPRGRARFAVPTENVRRNKRQIIARAQRPRNLKNVFVVQTRKGPVLFQRLFANKAGKYTARKVKSASGAKIVPLYGLERSVQIKKRSAFYEPIRKVVKAKLSEEVRDGILGALRTMR